MKLAITARIRKLFDRYSVRITIGVLFSLFVHGFILSLQLGLPGIGLPGLGLPWSERRAQTPELSIRIANVAGSPKVESVESPAPIDSKVVPKPEEAVTTPDQVVTDLPDARVRQAPSAADTVSPNTAKALKSSPANANQERKTGSPPPDDQSAPAPANSQAQLISLTGDYPDTFSVPAPDLDDWWRDVPKFDVTPIQIRPPDQLMPPAIAIASPKQTIQQAQDPAPAVQKPSEQESFERPDETKAKEQEQTKSSEVATEVAEHKKGEEIAAQEAARKQEEQEAAKRAQDEETRKQEDAARAEEAARQLAAKKLEEEKIARREQEAAEKKQEEQKQLKQQEADRQTKELAAQKQAEEIANQKAAALAVQKQREEQQREEAKREEQEKTAKAAEVAAARKEAEEIAHQKAVEQEKQKQEEKLAEERKEKELAEQKKAQELAAQEKAKELAAQQKAEADATAAAQRENARAAAAATATNSNGNGTNGTNGTNGATGNQQKGSATGDLASRAMDQVGKIDFNRIAPSPSTNQPEEDSRRRSIFGMIDHDVVVDAYIRGWRNKIERNGSLNYSQSSKDLAREDPVVTVAIRSDGSVEDIIINRSSGRSDLDEAVKRIVRVNAPYGAFPDNLARKYPVIEIRRVWSFAETLHLLEEVR